MAKQSDSHIMKRTQGVALIYAILILGGVFVLSYAIGILTLRGMRQSQDVDKGMIAYYAAESGIEKGLYAVLVDEARDGGASGDFGGTPQATWSYEIKTENNEPFQQAILAADQALNFDDLDEDTYQVTICWDYTQDPDADLEVTHVNWDDDFANFDVGAGYTQNEQTVVKKVVEGGPSGDLTTYDAALDLFCTDFDFSGENNLVRVKALEGAIYDLYLDFDPDAKIDKVRIVSIGDYASGKYQKAMEANIDLNLGISGFFDYVMFSEEDLSKTFP